MFCIDFQKRMAQRNTKKKKNDFTHTQPYMPPLSSFRFQRHENRKQQTERKRIKHKKNMFAQSCYVYTQLVV